METILQQLFNGEIYPAEQFRPLVEEYMEIRKKQYEHYVDFIEKLKKLEPPLHNKFIKIMDEQLDTVPFEISKMFIDGFRLSAKR